MRPRAAGLDTDPARVGQPVPVYGAQSYRAFGIAAQTTVAPEALAVDLSDAVDPGSPRTVLVALP